MGSGRGHLCPTVVGGSAPADAGRRGLYHVARRFLLSVPGGETGPDVLRGGADQRYGLLPCEGALPLWRDEDSHLHLAGPPGGRGGGGRGGAATAGPDGWDRLGDRQPAECGVVRISRVGAKSFPCRRHPVPLLSGIPPAEGTAPCPDGRGAHRPGGPERRDLSLAGVFSV